MNGPRIGSLFSGSGMLDEGVRAVIGGDVAWHAEVEPAAVRVLDYRYPGVPNLGDITAVDWSQVEPVDVITGGSPCQDVSAAGKRAGMRAGTRSGLWASMVDAIDVLRPGLVVWENVRGVLSAEADSALEPCAGCVGDGDDGPVLRALGRVLGDLAELGYDASWHGLRAADVGAPHGRYRIFVVAHPASSEGLVGDRDDVRAGWTAFRRGQGAGARSADSEPWWFNSRDAAWRRTSADTPSDGRDEGRPESTGLVGGSDASVGGANIAADSDRNALRVEPITEPRCSGQAVAGHARATAASYSAGSRRDRRPQASERFEVGRAISAGGCADLAADAGMGRSQGRTDLRRGQPDIAWGSYEPAIRRWERLTRLAPPPTQAGPKGGQRLSARFTEWMQGWPDGWVTDVPGVSRNEALKLCGNGVVPQQAAEAVRRMLAAERVAA